MNLIARTLHEVDRGNFIPILVERDVARYLGYNYISTMESFSAIAIVLLHLKDA